MPHHQETTVPPTAKMRVKSSQITSSQTGKNRCITSIQTLLTQLSELKISEKESLKHTPDSLVVDGTLITVWNWASQGKTLFSGKHKHTDYNHQVICTLNGKLLAITDPIPGARYGVYAYRFHQLERFLDESTLADKGYIGLGLLTPTKRKPGVKMRATVKENNRRINRLRSVVERVIAQIKIWRVLHTGFRRPLSLYVRVFSVVRALIFFAASDPL